MLDLGGVVHSHPYRARIYRPCASAHGWPSDAAGVHAVSAGRAGAAGPLPRRPPQANVGARMPPLHALNPPARGAPPRAPGPPAAVGGRGSTGCEPTGGRPPSCFSARFLYGT
jgi:hypothetical protein